MNRRHFIKQALAATVLMGNLAPAATSAQSNKGHKVMNILVLTGSPRQNGNSNILAGHFIKGATEAGHTVHRFDAAQKNVHPCTACNTCGMNGPCIFKDDFETVRELIIPAHIVVFATPMYYFGVSAQLKAVIDRFYAINGDIHAAKKSVLLMTYANTAPSQAEPVLAHYATLLDYLGWQDAGRIIAPGVWPAGAINRTAYPKAAYELGKKL